MFYKCLVAICLTIFFNNSYASTIHIKNTQFINTYIHYKNAIIDLTHGNLIVNPGASLKLENCIIYAKVSPQNQFIIKANQAQLYISNNQFRVTTEGIIPNPMVSSPYNVIIMDQSSMIMNNNHFEIDSAYTVRLLQAQNNTNKIFLINNNFFHQFHGGFYLSNMKNITIKHNFFEKISLYNVFYSGEGGNINHNIFLFPGNLLMGDAIDLVNVNRSKIVKNEIASSAGYGILLMNAKNILIDKNKISDGLSYGIYIQSLAYENTNSYLMQLYNNNSPLFDNDNIVISHNYMAQNRYGLGGKIINHLFVINNIFIQLFDNASNRQFWTNNKNLLPTTTELVWLDNYYKEAFTQDLQGDNTNALQFVNFPKEGGVIFH